MVKADLDTSSNANVIIASHAGILTEWFVDGRPLRVNDFVESVWNMILEGALVSNHVKPTEQSVYQHKGGSYGA